MKAKKKKQFWKTLEKDFPWREDLRSSRAGCRLAEDVMRGWGQDVGGDRREQKSKL